MDQLQSAIQELERGKESARQIRTFFHEPQGSSSDGGGDDPPPDHHCFYKGFDDHFQVVLTAFNTALSVLTSSDFVEALKRPKFGPNHFTDDPLHFKSEDPDFDGETPKDIFPTKDRRGSYKRRRIGQSIVMEMANLTDDGFAWRKYGQKTILNAEHPRNYYRCTHKNDQGCLAIKQVQQISENPTMYRLTYYGQHTCKNPIRNPPIMFDSPDQDSSILVSFETSDPTAKQALNPFMFSSAAASSSSSSSGFPIIKQECSLIKERMTSAPSDLTHLGTHNQNSPSSDYLCPSPDVTIAGLSSTPASDQGNVFSSGGVYSSTASPHDEEDYSYIMADSIDLGDLLQGIQQDEIFHLLV